MAYPYYQPYQQANSFQNGTSSLIWISGEAAARAYPIAPNATVALWDTDSQTVYLKSADMTGMPTIKTLDYTIREMPAQAHENGSETHFATKEDISTLQAEIARIKEELKHGKPALSDDAEQ